MGTVLSVSASTVLRHWQTNGLKPHILRDFKVSRDPKFVEKLEDIVGLPVPHDPNTRTPERTARASLVNSASCASLHSKTGATRHLLLPCKPMWIVGDTCCI